jgi:hypothetical protein
MAGRAAADVEYYHAIPDVRRVFRQLCGGIGRRHRRSPKYSYAGNDAGGRNDCHFEAPPHHFFVGRKALQQSGHTTAYRHLSNLD